MGERITVVTESRNLRATPFIPDGDCLIMKICKTRNILHVT